MHDTEQNGSSFDTYITLEEALALAPERFVNSHQVLFWIRDTLVRDTPFRYEDIYQLVRDLDELAPGGFEWSGHTLRKTLSWFKRSGHIKVMDDYHKDPSQHVYIWTLYYQRRLDHIRSRKKHTGDRAHKAWRSALSGEKL